MNKAEFAALSDDERIRTLEGTAFYAHVQNPDHGTAKRFNAPLYYILQLGLDEAGVAAAKSFGLKVIDPTDHVPLPHVKIKRKVKDETNPTASKPDLVDSQQNAIPDGILIGNGSKVIAKFGTYWYDQMGGGVGTALFKLQVRDLVPYEGTASSGGSDSDLVMDDSGWTVDASSGSTDDSLFDVATA